MKVGVIRNPVSGGGLARARWRDLETHLGIQFADIDIHDTLEPGHASAIAKNMAEKGFHLVIAIGGDGTMPIRVAIVDGDTTTYTDLQPFEISLNPGETTGQFLYTKADVPQPAGMTDLAQIFIGFDEGPAKPAKKKKK